MVLTSACWGMGYAALMVATALYGWDLVRKPRAARLSGQVLLVTSTLVLWAGLFSRAIKGHGWPLVTPSDAAAGIALLTLLIHLIWSLVSPRQRDADIIVAITALLLLSFALSRFPRALATYATTSKGAVLSAAFTLCGGSLLALAAAVSLNELIRNRQTLTRADMPYETLATSQRATEILVRGALFCLAVTLAIDTWWLQMVGLGNKSDAQQAGIAIAWMVYFVALRLRASPRWRGWPWAMILIGGFVCTLPILLDVPWLESQLPI
jgi:hypothetical protein